MEKICFETSKKINKKQQQISVSFIFVQIIIEIINNIATIQQIAVEGHFQTKYDEIQLQREALVAKVEYEIIKNK